MATTAREFLEFAEEIVNSSKEISHRNAASRAYYAAYHYAQPIAERLDKTAPESAGLHTQTIAKFINSTNMKCKSVGYLLKQAHGIRISADYDIEMTFSKTEAETAIGLAKKIIGKIDEVR